MIFFSTWLGILNLETGDLTTANAGHEYPLLCRKDGTFEIVKDEHGFVLGGMHCKETNPHLNSGDTLFVYTDGMPEANNPNQEQFGLERTVESLNNNRGMTMEDMTKQLKKDIDAFADQAPQFDDATMPAGRMIDYAERGKLETVPNPESIEPVEDFVRRAMEAAGVPMKPANKINIAVDEVYSNIVQYSGATKATVRCKVEENTITVEFRDNGLPYDPTQAKAPDLSADLEDRPIGGLGIFMTKKLMDSLEYRFEKNQNTVILKLRF